MGSKLKWKLRWEVQTHTICDGWANTWTDEDGRPQRFMTRADAKKALDEFMLDSKWAQRMGHIDDVYDPADYRVACVK